MLNIIKKLKNNKKIFIAVISVLIIVGFLFNVKYVMAAGDTITGSGGVGDKVLGGVGAAVVLVLSIIAYVATAVIGLIMTVVVGLLIQVAQYGNIINVSTVIQGWVIVRDLCNMLFILILLVIAFATILRVETYSWKKLLPKLLIMAVLINFSRTIFGLLIDFSQVVMLTFVNAFSAGGGWFMDAFRVNAWYSMQDKGSLAVTTWSTAVSIIAGVIAAIISLIVVSVMLAILIMRIVMLWIYTIFSPLVFMGFAVPGIQKYTGKIWEDFAKQLIVGPVLAFFIWLALTTASTSSKDLLAGQALTGGAEICLGVGSFFCQGSFQQFLIVIGLLFGGLMVAQQLGGAAGSIAGKGLDWAKKIGGAPLAAGAWAGKGLFFKAGRALDTGQMWLQKRAKVEIPKSLNYRMIAAGWKADRAKKMADYESGVLTKTGPLHTMWQETFNKHLEAKQYGTVRKSKKERAEEAKEMKKLVHENSVLEERKKFAKMSEPEKEKWKAENIGRRKDQYLANGFSDEEAEKEVKKDVAVLSKLGSLSFSPEEADKKIKENREMINEYEDPRKKIARRKWLLSKGKAAPYEYVLSKAGDKEREDKEKKAMEARTQQRSFAVTSELIKAFNMKEDDKLASAFRILLQNNDMNDALKDKRIIDIMTRQNGILEKMAQNGALGDLSGGEGYDKNLDNLKKDFAVNPVTPAYAQAMVRGMLKEINVNEKKAARISNDLGEVSYSAGSGLLFGSALGNAYTGDFEYENLKFDKEKGILQTSSARKAAISGKYNTSEVQAKMRMLHPDMIIAEDPSGAGSRLTEDGEHFLTYSLTGNDLTQMNRTRPDLVRKIANSPEVLRGIKRLVKKLEDEKNFAQAKTIKYFTGYIMQKVKEGGGEKEPEKMERMFNSIS